MRKTRVKVCGLTTAEDARVCHSLGVDYLGLIFTESARRIDLETARAIRNSLPGATLIGVFADSSAKFVAEVARSCGMNMIQLHGEESPDYCEELIAHTRLPLIKALASRRVPGVEELGAYRKVSFFLFDLDKNGSPGEKRDRDLSKLWAAAAEARRKGFRIFLAGSLDPSNVRVAINEVRPFCVDVCSGVESAPGLKDLKRLKSFISEVDSG